MNFGRSTGGVYRQHREIESTVSSTNSENDSPGHERRHPREKRRTRERSSAGWLESAVRSLMLWLLEPDVFAVGTHSLKAAALEAGHGVEMWNDEWWSTERLPSLEGPVVFHGSLGNASRIASLSRWVPGAFCNTRGFHCSAWYEAALDWLVHSTYERTTVAQLVGQPDEVAGDLADASGEVFVRPDSPLKPFSGRVVRLSGVQAADLDHGFYYDDLELPIIVTPKRELGDEWRFVVARGRVVAGCRYEAQGRTSVGGDVAPDASSMAQDIARSFEAPDPVYVLDIVRTERGCRMLEINPFSGADLYGCDKASIVRAVGSIVDGASEMVR